MSIDHNLKQKERLSLQINAPLEEQQQQRLSHSPLQSHLNLEENQNLQIQQDPLQVEAHMQEQVPVVQELQQERQQEAQQPLEDDIHIAFDRKYAEAREGDNRMAAVRRKLRSYYVAENLNTSERINALQALIDECKAYCKGRIRLWGKGKKRLQQVKALREEAKRRLEKEREGDDTYQGKSIIREQREMHGNITTGRKLLAGLGAGVAVLTYIPAVVGTIGLKALMAPARFINRIIRNIQIKKGMQPYGMLGAPKMMGPKAYVQLLGRSFAGVQKYYSTNTPLKERFFEHNMDFATMDRAAMEMDRILEMVEEELEMDETEETKEEQAANEEELQREKEQDNPPDDLNKAVVYRRPRNKSKKKK